jgi:cytolysin (calcineurin-like family phosphatase)
MLGAVTLLPSRGRSQPAPLDVTFVFTNDIHTCNMQSGLSPGCEQEGKTDANLLRHIAAINGVPEYVWPRAIGGAPSGLRGAGQPIAVPRGVVVGGDMTDDGGGQLALPHEGTQLLQFSNRYRQGPGADRVHFPVYTGLGNHDLDQDGHPPDVDWYRRELRDYVELNHRSTVFRSAPVPVTNYDVVTDSYSWDWDGSHLVQMHRFAGDTRKDAIDSLPWLQADLAAYAADGQPVILFQHYGWDAFSSEVWDPDKRTFDDTGAGAPHWWSNAEREALIEAIARYNVVALFHGHQHESALVYRRGALDLFKPKAAYMGGFAIARVTEAFLDVVLTEIAGEHRKLTFTHAFSKPLAAR